MKGSWIVAFFVLGCGAVADKPDAGSPAVTITVVKDGNGGGTISSSPSGINCGSTCVTDVETGAAVVLTATADADSVFMGWGGGCSGTNSCVFTANANSAISATFAKAPIMITVTKTGPGMGTITSTPPGINCGSTCSAMFDYGTSVTLTATPSPNQNITWSGGTCTGNAPCVVMATTPQTLTAQFTIPVMYLIQDNGGVGVNGTMQKVTNFTTPTLLNVGSIGVGYQFADCAYNSADGMVYFVDGRPNVPTKSLYKLNLTTGAATLVGAHNVTDMFSFAYHPPTNAFYGIGIGGTGVELYRLDPSTGAPTLVGPTTNAEAMTWDYKRNRMVVVSAGGLFRTIDLTTGVQTPIPDSLSTVMGNNNGLTYDLSSDSMWMVSYSGGLAKYDINANFARTDFAAANPHTCIAIVP